MNSGSDRVEEFDLHAYVDDQLEPARREQVEAYLSEHDEDAGRVRAWRQQKELLKAAFDPVLREELPPRLTEDPPARAWRRPRVPGLLRQAALALLYLGTGVGGGYYLAQSGPPEPVAFERQAALAHAVYTPEVLHPVEVTADQQAHLVKWLSKRLDHPLSVPDLSEKRLHLVGGRLLPGERGPAAQFMYEDDRGRRLTLFVRSDLEQSHDSAFRFSRRDGVSVFYWIDDNLGYALSGDLEREPMLELATLIYAQINQ